jgi:hypothetical protein
MIKLLKKINFKKEKRLIKYIPFSRYWTISYDNGDICRFECRYCLNFYDDNTVDYEVLWSDYPNYHPIQKLMILFRERKNIRKAVNEINNKAA